MKDFLFPQPTDSKGFSLLLLCLRLFFGLMFLLHGLEKLYNYTELCFVFPDPMNIGSEHMQKKVSTWEQTNWMLWLQSRARTKLSQKLWHCCNLQQRTLSLLCNQVETLFTVCLRHSVNVQRLNEAS